MPPARRPDEIVTMNTMLELHDDPADVLRQALDWLRRGQRVALATVVATWGSSPRPVGSQLAAAESGAFAGSVSGGCVEMAVIQEARAVMARGEPRQLEFGISNEQAWDVGLACGGRIRIHLEAARPDPIERLLSARAARRSVVRLLALASGEDALWDGADGWSGSLTPTDEALAAAARALAADRSELVRLQEREAFVHAYNPPLRLIVVGAVHIAQYLAPMARLAGYQVTLIDPRTAFANSERFPEARLLTEWPDRALRGSSPDARTAVVTLTHDPKLDEPALTAALGSDAFYIGALGSRRTHAARLERLRAVGFATSQLARIHEPAGLALGGRSPADIALAILAEMTAVRHAPADM